MRATLHKYKYSDYIKKKNYKSSASSPKRAIYKIELAYFKKRTKTTLHLMINFIKR